MVHLTVVLIWGLGNFSRIVKLKSLFSRGHCGSIYGNDWIICQTKCLSICVFCQIAKLDVCCTYVPPLWYIDSLIYMLKHYYIVKIQITQNMTSLRSVNINLTISSTHVILILQHNKAWVTKSSCRTTANHPVELHV